MLRFTTNLGIRLQRYTYQIYNPHRRYSLSLNSALLSNLVLTCKSCGINLQTKDSTQPGYYTIAVQASKIKDTDKVFNKHVANLSLEDKQLLINNFDLALDVEYLDGKYKRELSEAKEQRVHFAKDHNQAECVRCRNSQYRSNYGALDQEFPVESLDTVVGAIPPDAKLVCVLNAQDFPMSLNTKIFHYRRPGDIKFVVNKCDLLFKNNPTTLKYGQTFVLDYLYSKHGVPRENVMVVSGTINWNIAQLLQFIDNDSYVVGTVNSGKSTIIKSLLYAASKPTRLSSRDRTRMEKEQDSRINSSSQPLSRYQQKKISKAQEALFKKKVGPGVSYMPGYTRGFIPVELGERVIYDVPGFATGSHGIYSQMDRKTIKDLTKGVQVYEKGFYFSKYQTLKPGQCLSMGGLFYLEAPNSTTMFQIRNCINFDYHIFSSFRKAEEVSTNLLPAMAANFVIHHDNDTFRNLQRYVVPPFYGPIDLVIQNVGHLSIQPTGSKTSNDPLVIYLPKGVDAVIRQPITNYIAKTFTGRDSKGNPLRKENIISKSTFALNRYSAKTPFVSKLIPSKRVEENQIDADYTRVSEWSSIAGGERVKYDEDYVVDERNRYEFWSE